ncbi:Uncharacterised protein [Mycobacterium tuberculosis]|nr:Uncharacterised protein [Mycobacterium tuberculosis]
MSALCVQLGQADLDDAGDLIGGAVLRPNRQQHWRAEVHRDPAVDRELGGAGDVGVVTADDHHRVTLVGHCVIRIDNFGDRVVAVSMQLLVGHANTPLIGQARTGVREQ